MTTVHILPVVDLTAGNALAVTALVCGLHANYPLQNSRGVLNEAGYRLLFCHFE
jgi:hypothetical protein